MENKYMSFEEENNEVLEFMLEDKLFRFFNDEHKDKQKRDGLSIELYITASCNQKCKYCYLVSHGDKLYPPELRNHDKILNNLRIFLNYLEENEYKLYELSIFSGEIWSSQFGISILDELLKFVKKNTGYIKNIMLPTNCSFLLKKEYREKIQNFIDEFDKNGTRLVISASVDGKIIESDTRPYKDDSKNFLKDESFYHNLFAFCLQNYYGFHPMVSAYSIEKWIDNFDWWMDVFNKYGFDFFQNIMFLEVRNDGWTQEKIVSYLKFLNHVIDYVFKNIYKSNKNALPYVFYIDNSPREPINYNITSLSLSGKIHGCTVGRTLAVRLGDLSIVPCHRLSYEKLIYGNFIVKDEKVVGIHANNIQMANKIFFTTSKFNQKCDSCKYNDFCMRGCFGSQFEVTKDPFYPIDSVCNLFMAKISFMIVKYEKMGVINELRNMGEKTKHILSKIELVKSTKEFKEWEKIANTII